MNNTVQEKRMASVVWVFLLLSAVGVYASGHFAPAMALLALVVVFGIANIRMPPKGIRNTVANVNPDMNTVVWDWYIPLLLKHWKVVLFLLMVSGVVGSFALPTMVGSR